MSKLLDNLRQLIQRQITERGLVLWYDPEKAYNHAVDRLALENVEVLKFEEGYFRLREAMVENRKRGQSNVSCFWPSRWGGAFVGVEGRWR